MHIKESKSRVLFRVINVTILLLLALLCLLPFINAIAISLSQNQYVAAGRVLFWPKGFTTVSYRYLINRASFWSSFRISIIRCVLGTAITLVLVLLTAYPLSKDSSRLAGRTVYSWYFFITMLIGGGMIPLYLLVNSLGMRNTIWSLVLPGALPAYYVVLMLNFFRQIPIELEEAATIDGAGQLCTLLQVYIPVSLPSIATITLFSLVGHWNNWFDGTIYISQPDKLPLMTFLRNAVSNLNMSEMTSTDMELMKLLSDRSLKCAQIITATVPILCVYPFLQRYFVKGMVVGSVKG